ncbi:hypothetical protein HDK77DRAFT_438856 [Phyllosticta capitalensis]
MRNPQTPTTDRYLDLTFFRSDQPSTYLIPETSSTFKLVERRPRIHLTKTCSESFAGLTASIPDPCKGANIMAEAPRGYRIFALPRNCSDPSTWKDLVERQKNFRLMALQVSPEAYASTYEREMQLAWETWEDRLKDTQATTFVAVATLESKHPGMRNLDMSAILAGDWLGHLVLVEIEDDLDNSTSTVSPSTESNEDRVDDVVPARRFRLSGMFVKPTAQRLGVGRTLVEHAIWTIKSQMGRDIQFTLVVDADNDPARALYERSGFRVVREEWYESDRAEIYAPKEPLWKLAAHMEYQARAASVNRNSS